MKRRFLLAAETYNYSFNRYAEKVDMGALRFTKLMPDVIVILQEAEEHSWNPEKLAEALEMKPEEAELLRQNYEKAKYVIDAPTPAETFRRGVRHSIQNALREGMNSNEDTEMLVEQICYRAADLSYLLDIRNQKLSDYSVELRVVNSKLYKSGLL